MAKVKQQKLTVEQQTKLLLTPCKNINELKAWIKYFLSIELPDTTVSRYADTNPLLVIWEVYNICVNRVNPSNIQDLLFVAGRGSGKCVKKGTLILTKGGPKPIEDVRVNDVVFTGWDWRPVKEFFDEGIKDGIEIKTKVGNMLGSQTLTGSLKHRVQAINKLNVLDWVHLKDLRVGDYIYHSCKEHYQVDKKSRPFNEGWILGNIVGDGNVQLDSKHNKITVCGSDLDQLNHLDRLIIQYWGKSAVVRRNSVNNWNYIFYSKKLCDWFTSLVSGHLAYDKKLRSLKHDPNFLAGFISGLMETDGSKDSICLANRGLIEQISTILSIFGVVSSVNLRRKKASASKFTSDMVQYASCEYKTPLHEYLMPLYSKRAKFIDHANKMNQQFRFPASILREVGSYIKSKYDVNNGWMTVDGKRVRANLPFSKELWGKSKDAHTYRHKIESLLLWLKEHNDPKAAYLNFVLDGYFEVISEVNPVKAYFYDLEIDETHSYWSNGFISHNTLGMAIAELMIILHDKRDVVHVGAIQNQAERCYAYQKNFLYNRKIKPLVSRPDLPEESRILEKANMSKSLFNIDSEKVTLEVLPCTLKALNGPHVPLVVVDEIDTVSGEGVKAYKEISGMLDSKKGRKALRVGISTRKSRYGLMNAAIENAAEANRTVRRWTAFEFTERCGDERSGTKEMDLYVNQDRMEVLTEAEYNKKDKNKQKEYMLHKGFEGCAKCPLFSICLTDAKKQVSKSPMLKTLDELIQKVRSEGADWALAQLMNLKPSVEGIIFREFEERLHCKTWNQMWAILTGKEFPGECTHDMFVKKCHELNIPCYAGIDWGFTSPNTVVFFFIDKRDNVYIVKCDGMTHISQPAWIHHIKTKYHNMYRVQLYVPDQADQGAIQEMQKAGLPVSNVADKGQIMTGIQVIKKLMKIPGTTEPKLFLVKETCQPLINEFTLYHYKLDAAGNVTDTPEGEHDHWIDALRYPLTLLLGKTNIILGGGLEFDSSMGVQDNLGNFNRTPTAVEFAASKGIPLNQNEADPAKLGKIGKKSDLDDPGDETEGGSGSFLWSFN
jgi:intein/homing endonuclease